MTATIYIGSRIDQPDDNQLTLLIEFAISRGWNYIVFSENISIEETQSVKKELLVRLRRNEFDIVLVHKLRDWVCSLTKLINEISELL